MGFLVKRCPHYMCLCTSQESGFLAALHLISPSPASPAAPSPQCYSDTVAVGVQPFRRSSTTGLQSTYVDNTAYKESVFPRCVGQSSDSHSCLVDNGGVLAQHLDEPSVHPKWAPVTGKWTKKGTCHTVRKTRLKNMKPIPGKKKCPKKTVVVQVHEQLCTTVLPRACIYALQCVSFELLHVVCCSNSKETQGSSQCRQEVSCIETSVARLSTSNCLSTRILIVCVCEN